eukprot:288502_1
MRQMANLSLNVYAKLFETQLCLNLQYSLVFSSALMHSVCYLSQKILDGLYKETPTNLESNNNYESNSILEEVIKINHPPLELGVRFGVQSVIINEISMNSIACKLGLIVGDKLIKINNKSLSNISPSEALKLFFNSTSLPFFATFEKSITKYIDESLQDQNENTLTANEFNYDIDVAALLLDITSNDSNDVHSENTPYSPISLITHEPTPYHMHTVELLKDLLSDNAKLDHKSFAFIKAYIINDVSCKFNQYLSQSINDEKYSSPPNKQTVTVSTPGIEKLPSKLRLKLKEMSHCATLNTKLNVTHFADDKIISILANNGFCNGIHKWSFKILECSINRQEIGVIGIGDIKNITINTVGGIKDTKQLSARAIYSTELFTNSSYYASYNKDGTKRCFRNLAKHGRIGWCSGDTITIFLDLQKWVIKFLLNGENVRKTISLQRNQTYYPIISFNGHCRYQLISFR